MTLWWKEETIFNIHYNNHSRSLKTTMMSMIIPEKSSSGRKLCKPSSLLSIKSSIQSPYAGQINLLISPESWGCLSKQSKRHRGHSYISLYKILCQLCLSFSKSMSKKWFRLRLIKETEKRSQSTRMRWKMASNTSKLILVPYVFKLREFYHFLFLRFLSLKLPGENEP